MAAHVIGMFWTAAFAAIGGLVLIFTSTSFGVARGNSWLQSQGGMGDTSSYDLIVETAITKFLLMGSLLLGAGFLLTIATFFYFLLNEKARETRPVFEEELDAGGEV
ncbi:hypothetical protein [Planococcus sp. YIM B11945]|uniref:hypothetical protein n=1 Tax=Planococcus sp. YIM B11945 TaxID=3435410 RepID=UPI003D7D38C7